MKQIQPLDDGVLIQLDKPERLSATRKLILPDSAQRQAHELYTGTVLKTGPGMKRKDGRRSPMTVKCGDRVLFYWASAVIDVTAFNEGDAEFRLISERGIQGVLS